MKRLGEPGTDFGNPKSHPADDLLARPQQGSELVNRGRGGSARVGQGGGQVVQGLQELRGAGAQAGLVFEGAQEQGI